MYYNLIYKNLRLNSIESCIINKDAISNNYYQIKDDEVFIVYSSKMKI